MRKPGEVKYVRYDFDDKLDNLEWKRNLIIIIREELFPSLIHMP